MGSLLRPLAALRRALAAQRAVSPSSSPSAAARATIATTASAPSSSPSPPSSSPSPPPPAPRGAFVLPLPKLSHRMTKGAVARWRVREGESFPQYAVLAEVETEELVDPIFALGAFAGTVRMLIEAQQAGTVARLLVPDGGGGGGMLAVGTPIAVVVGEDEVEEAEAEAEEEGSAGGGGGGGGGVADVRARLLRAARDWRVPTRDVLDEGQPRVPVLEWQSFLAEDKGDKGGKAGGGGGCM